MAANDNIIFKTNEEKTIDDLFKPDLTPNIAAGGYTDSNSIQHDPVAISPGTVYFTGDGHIVYDIADYIKTRDTKIVSGKTYYTRTLNSSTNQYTYTAVSSPSLGSLSSYYEPGRIWMSKEAYSAIYAKDIDATNDIASLLNQTKYWANIARANF